MLKQVYLNLKANKVRTFLSLLGILIGVAAVVALLSAGEMAAKAAIDQLKSMGSNLISVSIYNIKDTKKELNLSKTQLRSLSQVIGIAKTAPIADWSVNVRAMGVDISASVLGVDHALLSLAKAKIKQGRFLRVFDNMQYFCVVGHLIAKDLIKSGIFPVVGSRLTIANDSFQIIGVLDDWPSNFFIPVNLNRSILVPIELARYVSSNKAKVKIASFEAKKTPAISIIQSHLQSLIKQWYPQSRVFFRNPLELINQVTKQKQNFSILLGLIAGISLLVGGIGIMNIMLASIAERKFEIGLRMAIGARGRDICYLFLLESIVLSGLGGFFGIIIGLGSAGLIAVFSGWPYGFFMMPILLGGVISCFIGVFFGFYPAYQASKLDPIIVLRGL